MEIAFFIGLGQAEGGAHPKNAYMIYLLEKKMENNYVGADLREANLNEQSLIRVNCVKAFPPKKKK